MKKLVSFILFALFFTMQTGTFAAATLPANTPVEIQASSTYASNELSVGDNLNFKTTKNITLNGTTVIPAGAKVTATVQKVNKRGRIGIPGEIIVGDFNTVSAKGAKVALVGSLDQRGKSKIALSVTLSVLVFPLFLLMKGKDTSIPEGYQMTVYTANAVSL